MSLIWENAACDAGMFARTMYIILVRGALEESWSVRLSGMSITIHETPSGPRTTLAGVLIDQAALHGVLKTLYDLGLPVLSITSA